MIIIIERELYMQRIRPFMNKPIVKVLTGIRRCGKSVMLELIKAELSKQNIPESQFVSINFESQAVDYVKSVDSAYQHIKSLSEQTKNKLYLFLDEIQELNGWEKMINSLMIDIDADIYITGSNAKLLSGELATYLGGRYVEFKIYPFSYREVLDITSSDNNSQIFNTYLTRGGMPFLYRFPMDEQSSMQYLTDIYDSVILKDIATRHKIRDIELLKRIIQFFIANIGNTFSAGSVTKYLKNELRSVSGETVYNYIEYCKNACLLHLVSREDCLGKKVLQFHEKIYIADHGIREAIYGSNMRDINQVLENIVYTELLRRNYNVTVGKNGNREIDFIAVQGNEKVYVQVTYL
ncbi:MAG: ATP-binding protein, partial [Oscillospiraceae bacterium]|nr:ATP-binding protein [Oscillospiraceae bacterium]